MNLAGLRHRGRVIREILLATSLLFLAGPLEAEYVNFESSHVHPIALTPSGGSLLVVNTPDALLEVFTVGADGSLTPRAAIPVGLEPVSVRARSDTEAWVVNHLSDTMSVVDLSAGATLRTLPAGDEPDDVVFALGKAFVTSSQEDALRVFDLGNLSAPPQRLDLFGSKPRALAVSTDGSRVYAVVQDSGNQTTVINANVIFGSGSNPANLNLNRLAGLGLNNIACVGPHPPYPPLPTGIVRNPALTDPQPPAVPPVGLIVKWDGATGAWRDDAGQDWTNCLPYRLPDHDLFVIVPGSPGAPATVERTVDHLGTTLFEVSVRPGAGPGAGRIYVANTEARNLIRFEHPLGVQGHMVDNRLSIVDPAAAYASTIVDLNTHIDRTSDPGSNLLEREASLSQPGMMVWDSAGRYAYLTAIGSRKLFRVDGACLSGGCIFGVNRALPDAVVVGEGPTGVALHEASGRLYVLNRFSNSISIVAVAGLVKIDEVQLHDASPQTILAGRHFLYDGIDTSGHGDAACSSCHVSGDKDNLAWDLGNPEGAFVPYGTANDNVRFIIPQGGVPTEVPASPPFSAHTGFDPQKGPMTTQTLRGMLEPLHWRGDRPTMNAFNKAFVGLMGTKDIGPINQEPAGISAIDMESYRQFALGINLPPNPYRNVDDTLPDLNVTIPGNPFTGNPAAGELVFRTNASDAAQPCAACHAAPFGTAGGKLGGIGSGDPSTARAALFNGNADGVPHSDLKVPHNRNLYTKFGPAFGNLSASPPVIPEVKSGFGFIHDGSIPDLGTFLSAGVFNLTPQQVRDLTLFLIHFPTNVKPAVGRNLTVPAGTPPTGAPEQEGLLATLVRLGNLADAARHCDLVASAPAGGRARSWFLAGTSLTGEGMWSTDVDGADQVTTTDLRSGAAGPITFLCATLGSGIRLGADRDEDGHFNASDCAPADPAVFASPAEVADLALGAPAPIHLAWDDQSAATGPGVRYDVAGGRLSDLRVVGLAAATACIAGDLAAAGYTDGSADPAPGDGLYFLVRAEDACGTGTFGPGDAPIDPLICAAGP
jgi:DNA-binding beta-propeller fold protein YncE